MTIEEEIKQKSFRNERTKVIINILFTASQVQTLQSQILRPFDISWQQFNILRILKGQKGKPANLKTITSRMVDQASNTSRLVEKLKVKGLLDRVKDNQDRRKVNIYITQEGLQLVNEATEAVNSAVDAQDLELSEEEIAQLNNLLDRYRN